MPPEREEAIGFKESEEVEWREYLHDFRATVYPMFQREGFTYVEAIMFWRQEMLLSQITELKDKLI